MTAEVFERIKDMLNENGVLCFVRFTLFLVAYF